jgi:hypothetical protein
MEPFEQKLTTLLRDTVADIELNEDPRQPVSRHGRGQGRRASVVCAVLVVAVVVIAVSIVVTRRGSGSQIRTSATRQAENDQGTRPGLTTAPPPSQTAPPDGTVPQSGTQPLLDGQKVATPAAAQALVNYQLTLPSNLSPTGVFVRQGTDDPAAAAVVFTVTDAAQPFVILEIPASMDEAALEKRKDMGAGPGSRIKAALVVLPDGKRVVTFAGENTTGVNFLIGSVEIRVYGNTGEFTIDSATAIAGQTWVPVRAG